MREFTITQNGAGMRCDRFLGRAAPDVPSSTLQKAFRKKDIKRNGKPCRADVRLAFGDVIRLYVNIQTSAGSGQLMPDNYGTLETKHIVYECGDYIVLHKPAGIPSQPDFEEMARAYIGAAEDSGFQPSLCHRLDRNTEGLLLFAKNAGTLRDITAKIKNREVVKTYHCLVEGCPSPGFGEWRDWLWKDSKEKRVYVRSKQTPGASEAVLRYKVLETANGRSLLEITLITGRTHQIRVQCASRGFAIIGDGKYGRGRKGGPLSLCAVKLELDGKVYGVRKEFTGYRPHSPATPQTPETS
jgi:23S rRNA pseudouridine955/2504/2580 synthase